MAIESLLPLAGAWLWSNYGKSLANSIFLTGKVKWDETKWNAAARAYREKIIKLYDSMQIMGMAGPVPLDDIFTDLYLLDKPTAFSRFDIESLKKMSTSDPDAAPRPLRSEARGLEAARFDEIFTHEYSSDTSNVFPQFHIEWMKGLPDSLANAPPRARRSDGLRLVVEKGNENDKQNPNQAGNLFILGKPGAGKTTFLKYISVKAAQQSIDKVPIFISLKRWAGSSLDLLSFMAERFDICNFPAAQLFIEELLKSGNAIVLFDGLDEVNQSSGQRDKQTREMNNFVEKYDRTQCLITCRIAASDYSFRPFTYVEIADFTEKQIRTFVGNWFRKDGERDTAACAAFLAEFTKPENSGLRELARTPLLLTLLCLAFDAMRTFPQRRAILYKEALDALLKTWDSSRGVTRDDVYRKLSLTDKVNLLARIAAETFEKNEHFIPQTEMEIQIVNYLKTLPQYDIGETADGEGILKSIEAQHGIFVERARGLYSFSHLTFQEYFTARYIVANAAKGALTNLVKSHYSNGRWREVFLLTTSLLANASQFLSLFARAVDELLGGDGQLRKLLAWSDKKAASFRASSWVVRPFILFVEYYHSKRNRSLESDLDRDRILDNPRAIVFDADRAFNMARQDGVYIAFERDRSLDIAHDFDLAQAHAHMLAHDLAFDLNLSLVHDFDLAGAHALGRDRVRDFNLNSDLYRSRECARALGLKELAKELAALSIPSDKATAAVWQEFADELNAVSVKHRDISQNWYLTEIQETTLADYLNATRLLHDCLELAHITSDEKQAMLNSLYSPRV